VKKRGLKSPHKFTPNLTWNSPENAARKLHRKTREIVGYSIAEEPRSVSLLTPFRRILNDFKVLILNTFQQSLEIFEEFDKSIRQNTGKAPEKAAPKAPELSQI
jgi:hypothetical protein